MINYLCFIVCMKNQLEIEKKVKIEEIKNCMCLIAWKLDWISVNPANFPLFIRTSHKKDLLILMRIWMTYDLKHPN